MYEAIRATGTGTAVGVLHRRFKAILPDVTDAEVLSALAALQSAPLLLCTRMALVKTICNAWCFSVRMHSEDLGCLFGCVGESDSMVHYLSCLKVRSHVEKFSGFRMEGSPAGSFRRLLTGMADNIASVALVVDTVFFTYNAVRNGVGASVVNTLWCRVKVLCHKSAFLRRAVHSSIRVFNANGGAF